MNELSRCPEDADQILAQFLAELEHATEPEKVIESFSAQFPNRAREFRDMVELRQILDQSATAVDPGIPARLGDFRIVRRIDHGGMGAVCEAIQEPLDRRVVVKIIRHGRTSSEARERFLREQRVLATLHQTHIVPVFAAGEEGSIQYFAMPYIDGVNLHRLIGTAREHGSTCPGNKMPRIAELVETAKASGTLIDRSPLPTDLTSRQHSVWNAERHAADSATPTLAAEHSATECVLPHPVTLSIEYFRSVAQIMSDVAESVHHAHVHGFIHRDLKPSNIMVDPAGQSWLIDFGLAGHVHGSSAPSLGADEARSRREPVQTVGPMGTPGYMAPEQESGQATGVHTDVWGLGVTLYELATLRRAFPRYESADPGHLVHVTRHESPRKFVRNFSRDLEAICDKALHANPVRRYDSAQAFADDLKSWLKGEPTTVRPARAPRRVFLWARRNKGWASVLAVLLITAVTTASAAFAIQRSTANAARREAEAATLGQLTLRAQSLVTRKEAAGWSDEAWDLCRRAAAIQPDEDVRDLAVAALGGLDARRIKLFQNIRSNCLLFDPQSGRLLMNTVAGAWEVESGSDVPVPGAAKLWDVVTDELRDLKFAGSGPVAFADEAPRQLVVADDDASLAWIDLTSHAEIMRFVVPQEFMPGEIVDTCVTPDSSTVAAILSEHGHNKCVLVWDGSSGQLMQQLSTEVESFALSPDGSLLGTADEIGDITVRSIRNSKHLYTLRGRGHRVRVLAFGRDPRRYAAPDVDAARCGWLLAAGCSGGPVTIWDIESAVPLSYCRGSWYYVSSLALSPDGATLASGDQSKVRLWDVMTGQPILVLGPGSDTTSLAFSSDGKRLATNCTKLGPGVSVWEFASDRGVQTLRGLTSPIAYVCLSADGSTLAANTHDWQVGIWDLTTGFLRHILAVPKAVWADNAAMAFSRDEKRFAFAAGSHASLWNVDSGENIVVWQLNEGLVELLAFSSSERLLSFREETLSGEGAPYGSRSYKQDPRVYRVRDLLSEDATKPIAEVRDFHRLVYCAACTTDGSHFIIDGLGGPNGERRMLKIFSTVGQKVCEIPMTRYFPFEDGWLILDPSGTRLAALTENGSVATLLEVPSGKFLGRLDPKPWCLSPQATRWVDIGTANDRRCGLWLFQQDGAQSRSILGLGLDSQVTRAAFSNNGSAVAWGDANGAVSVCSIPRVQQKLAEIGLGWE